MIIGNPPSLGSFGFKNFCGREKRAKKMVEFLDGIGWDVDPSGISWNQLVKVSPHESVFCFSEGS